MHLIDMYFLKCVFLKCVSISRPKHQTKPPPRHRAIPIVCMADRVYERKIPRTTISIFFSPPRFVRPHSWRHFPFSPGPDPITPAPTNVLSDEKQLLQQVFQEVSEQARFEERHRLFPFTWRVSSLRRVKKTPRIQNVERSLRQRNEAARKKNSDVLRKLAERQTALKVLEEEREKLASEKKFALLENEKLDRELLGLTEVGVNWSHNLGKWCVFVWVGVC